MSQLTWYAGLLQSAILAELNNEKLVRSRAYNVPIKVWTRADGSIERSELARSTGDREVDRAIERARGARRAHSLRRAGRNAATHHDPPHRPHMTPNKLAAACAALLCARAPRTPPSRRTSSGSTNCAIPS